MDQQKKATEEFINRVKEKYADKMEKIILFGSYARGDYTKESDIDVLIVLSKEDYKVRRDIMGSSFDMLLETGVYISPKVISLRDYQNLKNIKSSFIQNVSREGIAVG